MNNDYTYEQIIYSYYDTIGRYVWCGTVTGEHVVDFDAEKRNLMQ